MAVIVLWATATWANAPIPTTQVDRELLVPLGGLEQWISIRGDGASHPVLLVVQGGPGEAQWPAADIFKPWERRSRWCDGTSAEQATPTAVTAKRPLMSHSIASPKTASNYRLISAVNLTRRRSLCSAIRGDPRSRSIWFNCARTLRRLRRHRPGLQLGRQRQHAVRSTPSQGAPRRRRGAD